jgi:signal transduction histidine kinase/ActR/RegA family two-component response regulator
LTALAFIKCWGTEIVVTVSWQAVGMAVTQCLITILVSVVLFSTTHSQGKLLDRLSQAVEAAVLANKAKTLFISNISHDLRTPVHSILGLITLVEETNLNSIQTSYIDTIRASCSTLISVINNVLDLSKVETQRFEPISKSMDFFAMVENVSSSMAPLAEEKNLDFKVNMNIPNRLRYLKGDESCLYQILTNFIGNAIKFSEKGYVALDIRAVKALQNKPPAPADNNISIRFTIKDSGRGMSEDFIQSKMFKAFSRENNVEGKTVEGSGLGLFLCKRMLEGMGSNIQVRSEIGKGTEFFFVLSFTIVQDATNHKEAQIIEEFKTSIPHQVTTELLSSEQPKDISLYVEKEIQTWNGLLVKSGHLKRTCKESSKVIIFNVNSIEDIEHFQREVEELPPHKLQCFIIVSRLRLLAAINSSTFFHALQQHRTICAAVSYPLSSIKIHRAFISCLSHMCRTIQTNPTSDFPLLRNVNEDPFLPPHVNILLAEDNTIVANIFSTFFKQKKINHSVAKNGEEAVKIWSTAETPFDVILMDVQMPVMGGFEAAKRIRAMERAYFTSNPVKIIFISAGASNEEISKAKELGADEFLKKPVNLRSLMLVVQSNLTRTKE